VSDSNNPADECRSELPTQAAGASNAAAPPQAATAEPHEGVDDGPDVAEGSQRPGAPLADGHAIEPSEHQPENETDAPLGLSDPLPELRSIESELTGLRTTVEKRFAEDRTKDEAFSRLYEDLEIFRGQAAFQIARPVFLEIILLLDRLDGALESGDLAVDPRGFLESVRVELGEILARRAISPVASADELFDPAQQRAIKTVATDDEAQHNSIAQVLRQGYEQNGQVVRSADVIVRRYAPPVVADE
jgi:molecular chaperone GrpE